MSAKNGGSPIRMSCLLKSRGFDFICRENIGGVGGIVAQHASGAIYEHKDGLR